MTRPRSPALSLAAAALLTLASCSSNGGIALDNSTVASTTTVVEVPSTTTAPTPSAAPGAGDIGDPLTPGAGNGGYDVDHYDLDIDLAIDRSTIDDATATITAVATTSLSSFNLDLAGLDVNGVEVDGATATSTRVGDELVVTPADPLADGATFEAVVRYSGTPRQIDDPSAPGDIGWFTVPTGTFVASEPTGAKGFFPCNDHPSDKATYTFTISASSADTAVANGVLVSKVPDPADAGRTVWTFDQDDPMTTYLVQMAVGDYDLIESTGPDGLPLRHVVVRRLSPDDRARLDETGAQIEYFETMFGPYPFDTYGLLVADASPDWALETQTLTLLPAGWIELDSPEGTSSVMAHELAHQWFGNAVSPARWNDIWLNEGFATYGEWLWGDHRGTIPLDTSVGEAMDEAVSWRQGFGPVTSPAPETMFSPNQYGGAGIVLHALRLTVGDGPFFEILRTWVSERSGTSVTTADFEELAARISRQDLTAFFDAWLRSSELPPLPT